MCVEVKVGSQMIQSVHCVIVCCLVIGLQSSHGPIVETEIPYSRKRKVPFSRQFHRKAPFRFCFRFRIKNSTSISILQISISIFKFPFRFHFSSGKAETFHSIFIPTHAYYSLSLSGEHLSTSFLCNARLWCLGGAKRRWREELFHMAIECTASFIYHELKFYFDVPLSVWCPVVLI